MGGGTYVYTCVCVYIYIYTHTICPQGSTGAEGACVGPWGELKTHPPGPVGLGEKSDYEEEAVYFAEDKI